MFKLEIKGKEYSFEVVRRSIRVAEQNGVNLQDLGGFGATYDLFYIALLKHHPKLTREKAYDLFDQLCDDGEYDVSEVIELIGKGFEEIFSKLENKSEAKKKIVTQ